MPANGIGTVTVNINRIRITFLNVHYIHKLKLILSSFSRLDEKRVITTISKDQCTLFDRGARNTILGQIPKRNPDGLFITYISLPSGSETQNQILQSLMSVKAIQKGRKSLRSEYFWHKRMSHASENALNKSFTS